MAGISSDGLSSMVNSMNKLQVLIVEDDPTKLGALLDRLSEATFDVDVRNGPNEALKRVQGKRFNVVFIDLQLTKEETGKEPFYEGIALGEKVRQLAPEAAMVMYSGSISKGCEASWPHYRECMDVLKADAVMARSELFSMSSQMLETRLRDWLAGRERLSGGVHFDFEKDLDTEAVREVFGSDVVEHLIAGFAKSCSYFQVGALQPGYSGAAVLRVKGAQSPDFVGAVQLVIKLSKAKFALESELRRRPVPGSHYDAKGVSPYGPEVSERDGVYALAIPWVRNMILLREFLRVRGLTKGDQKVLSRVVLDLLVSPAKDAKAYGTFGLPASCYALRATAASEIVRFLSEAVTWKEVLTRADLRSIEATRWFVKLVVSGTWGFTTEGRMAAHLHGDFHCRNVFTAQDDGPVLIDFGRSAVYPRLFDFAALDTDLILSVLDCENGFDQDFSNINRWFVEATGCFPYTERTGVRAQTKAGWLRRVLLSEMVRTLPAVLPSEYRETVVFHLLRFLRFSNVTVPKRILATRLIERLVRDLGLFVGLKERTKGACGKCEI